LAGSTLSNRSNISLRYDERWCAKSAPFSRSKKKKGLTGICNSKPLFYLVVMGATEINI
jgi:hypothetical protein